MMISKRFKTKMSVTFAISGMLLSTIMLSGGAAYAKSSDKDCSQVPNHSDLKAALMRSDVNSGHQIIHAASWPA